MEEHFYWPIDHPVAVWKKQSAGTSFPYCTWNVI